MERRKIVILLYFPGVQERKVFVCQFLLKYQLSHISSWG